MARENRSVAHRLRPHRQYWPDPMWSARRRTAATLLSSTKGHEGSNDIADFPAIKKGSSGLCVGDLSWVHAAGPPKSSLAQRRTGAHGGTSGRCPWAQQMPCVRHLTHEDCRFASVRPCGSGCSQGSAWLLTANDGGSPKGASCGRQQARMTRRKPVRTGGRRRGSPRREQMRVAF